ncbi:hypothetical protein DSO57_1017157 [Entomophthora muscae]|uniref:Uncharacterized protein n=1 Tax=Entomophthora muscae TaxID=34485 RepID=A0ACC2RVX6_9FUNG|nr:hypothetical protein DSO57_1017157 [Entomophthora muscae]
MVKSIFKITTRSKLPEKKLGFLEGIKVQNSKGAMLDISDYWKTDTVLLKVLRRFGCPLCRYESRMLSELKPEFDALGVRLVAVGFDVLGLYDFMAGGYWEWEILLDQDRSLHTALNLNKLPISSGLKNLISATTIAATSAAHKAGIIGDFKGDAFQLGGTFVIEKGTGIVLYEHRQTGTGSFTSVKELYECCGGDPDEVEDKAPKECISYMSMCNLKSKCF